MDYYSIVLSAGKGTRMKSQKPKVLQEIFDKPMVSLVLEELIGAGVEKNYLVVGYKKEQIIETLDGKFKKLSYAEQKEQLGTGHAVMQLKDQMESLKGTTIITCGDTPLLTREIFKDLISYHNDNKYDLTILSTTLEDATGYGRIIRNKHKKVQKIVEQKDATKEEEKIKEINSGIYCINNELLFKHIDDISNDNVQKEYYLTDLVQVFKENQYHVGAYEIENSQDVMGVNDHLALAKATKVFQNRINKKHLENGVKIIDPTNTYISKDVIIGEGTIIYPNNYIIGDVKIGKDNIIKTSNYIENSSIGNNNEIGPMANIRLNTKIGDNTRIGNFVELKNTKFNNGAKSAHLTYLGDALVGENTNIGCGVITANYDGENKSKTVIGANSFIGSNVNLIAPVNIKDNVFVAAGTTLTKNVENDKFVIGRSREEIKEKK